MKDKNYLSTDEVLLLENLMYLAGQDESSPLKNITEYSGITVAEFLDEIKTEKLEGDMEYTSYTTGEDWKDIIQAVKNNDTLMNMEIAATHIDNAEGGGKGTSVVFLNEKTDEAVVAFRGTASKEWKDNFIGGGPTSAEDGVSTPQQENALDWYRSVYKELGLKDYSVTLTGHSKGGNKAKYITVLDDTVDRCVAFDGQGFSDEFLEEYRSRIAERQGLIENHNIDFDYVNLLLNDIGSRTFYKGYGYGSGLFLENHCPNTFFQFGEDGRYSMSEAYGQAWEMDQLHKFLNRYLRSKSPEEKAKALEIIGALVEAGFSGDGSQALQDALHDEESLLCLTDLLGYTYRYEKANLFFRTAVKGILAETGWEALEDYVEMLRTIQQRLIHGIPGSADPALTGAVGEWCRELLGLMDQRKLLTAGKKVDGDTGQAAGERCAEFSVCPRTLQKSADEMEGFRKELERIMRRLDAVAGDLGGEYREIRRTLEGLREEMRGKKESCGMMSDCLRQVAKTYLDTEAAIVREGRKIMRRV